MCVYIYQYICVCVWVCARARMCVHVCIRSAIMIFSYVEMSDNLLASSHAVMVCHLGTGITLSLPIDPSFYVKYNLIKLGLNIF
jgi:hypothetical protein